MGIKSMQGTSAFLEYIGPKGRKYKSNCIYFKNGICKCTKIQTYLGKCVGRVQCGYFNEDKKLKTEIELEEKELLNSITEKNNNNPLEGKVFRAIELGTGKIFEFRFVSKYLCNEKQGDYYFDSAYGRAFNGKVSSDIVKVSKKKKYRILNVKEGF